MTDTEAPRGALLTEQQASERLNVTVSCLQAWRVRGGGPRFCKLARRCVRYRESDLDAWIENSVRAHTSESAA
jgi:predicted DNA-binding transcriptional regulator AlpA